MKKRIYESPTVEQVGFAVEEVLGPSNTAPPELPDHDWVSYSLPRVDLDKEA